MKIMFTNNKSIQFCYLYIILATFVSLNVAEDPIVQLPKGKIRGHILESESGLPYYAFQEIPYAAPPVGKNRFQLPKEPEPWSGILNTTKNHIVCPQLSSRLNQNEACLFLNVYTPVAPGSPERLPVLVWIHGGAFSAGTGAYEAFNPKFIMDHGIVVVSINYRLGLLGFLTTNDDVIRPNLGLQDQLLALQWVNQNIELFGGNASLITLTGESSGSMSVGMHLMGPWPNNKPLFHAAILQSGSFLYAGRNNTEREQAFSVGHSLNSSFSSNNSIDLLKVLQEAQVEKIVKLKEFGSAFPVIDRSGVFSCPWMRCLENGNYKKVPIIIGFNSEELLLLGILPVLKQMGAALDTDLSQIFGSQFNMSKENKTIGGHLIRRIYTNTTFEDNVGAYIRFQSDSAMGTPIVKQAELQSKYADVYLYEFSYKGHLGGVWNIPNISGTDRVVHAEDLAYFWSDETKMDLSKYPVEDRLMLHRYTKMWTNFVKYHNPTPEKDPLLGNITWRKVDPKQPDSILYLNINNTLEMGSNPRYYGRVKKVMDYYITPEIII